MKMPLSDVKSWQLSHERKNPTKGQSKYYGNAGANLDSYCRVYRDMHGEDSDPMVDEVDSTAVIMSGHGKEHGRYSILDTVIQPSTCLTQLRASNPSGTTTSQARRSGYRHHEDDVSIFSFSYSLSHFLGMGMFMRSIMSYCSRTKDILGFIVKSARNSTEELYCMRSFALDKWRLVLTILVKFKICTFTTFGLVT
jgi:hypothetical protein